MASGGVSLEKEREDLRARLKDDIFSLWRNNKADKYNIGKHLHTLQQLHAKPGSGTFKDDLDELVIPRNTAYQRIKFYKRIEAIWAAGNDPDLYPVRGPYRFGTDDPKFPLETDYDEGEDGGESLEAAADRKQAEIDAVIKAEADKIEKLKAERRGHTPRLNISLLLPEDKREQFKKIWAKLGELERSETVYEAIINASTT